MGVSEGVLEGGNWKARIVGIARNKRAPSRQFSFEGHRFSLKLYNPKWKSGVEFRLGKPRQFPIGPARSKFKIGAHFPIRHGSFKYAGLPPLHSKSRK
jgi:hypothetical protein